MLAFELYDEYLSWVDEQVGTLYGVVFGEAVQAADEEFNAALDELRPPAGRLTLVRDSDGGAAGTGALKPLHDDIGYIKRMYVREAYRGKGLSRTVLDGLLSAAREFGYGRVRLESLKFMEPAHALYRSAGFLDIEPFEGTEMPDGHYDLGVFMELEL